ncbi:thioesterase II family protein [Amycolatopsis nigrescens]|uniref:thioesterase II family protein n=1 Tax=Amycolatopsis nigrescens TaxID=381445 RepID=UPI00037F4616|nr:thioesterase domain-containing protein [Amycolatopsis nigrescens]
MSAEEPAIRLLCFPPAGGYAAPFRAWRAALPPEIAVHPIEPPDGCVDVDAVLAAVEPEVTALADRPTALFGHSFGALLAYELAHRLRARRLPLARLAVSASPAPRLVTPGSHAAASDGSARVAAWFALADGYLPQPRPVLDCPVSVFGGLQDTTVQRYQLAAWRECTAGTFRLRVLPGSHDLLREGGTYVIRALERDLSDDIRLPEL